MTVFFVIGGIGIVLLVLALLLGDLLESVFSFDALDGLDALDTDVLSTAGIAGLLGGFGFGGALGLALSPVSKPPVVMGFHCVADALDKRNLRTYGQTNHIGQTI